MEGRVALRDSDERAARGRACPAAGVDPRLDGRAVVLQLRRHRLSQKLCDLFPLTRKFFTEFRQLRLRRTESLPQTRDLFARLFNRRKFSKVLQTQ